VANKQPWTYTAIEQWVFVIWFLVVLGGLLVLAVTQS
jgi:hypothetical protein